MVIRKCRESIYSKMCLLFINGPRLYFGVFFCFFYLPYLSSIQEKAMYHYVLDGKSALAWKLPFPGHLSST